MATILKPQHIYVHAINLKLAWSKLIIHKVCFFKPRMSPATLAKRTARAAQLAGELLSLKNHIYEYCVLIILTLYWLYVHKYAVFLILEPCLNLQPTLLGRPYFYISTKWAASFSLFKAASAKRSLLGRGFCCVVASHFLKKLSPISSKSYQKSNAS